MYREISVVLGLFVVTALVQAHEFWIESTRFHFKVGDTAEFTFMTGENFGGEKAAMTPERIAKMEHIYGDHVRDVSGIFNARDNKLTLTLNSEGTQLISLRGNNSFLESGAEEFNEYLKSDGLDDILSKRESRGELDKPARENYARCAKLLIQVGERFDDTYKKVVGLPLEIVPLSNPYHLDLTDEVKFQLYFQGRPLPYALVKVWNRGKGRTFIQNTYTEKDGTFTTRLSNKGVWMVSTVKMIESRQPTADYQSFWSTLVFGFNE